MDFALTQSQADLKATARRYLDDRYPQSRIAELSESAGDDRDAWPELRRLGWLDGDLGLVELTLLAEETGRALLPVPWLSTAALALPVYAAAGAELPGPATLADGSQTCRASRVGEGWRIEGAVPAVVDTRGAAEIVVATHTDAGTALFGVRPDAVGVSLAERAGIDPSRGFSELTLDHAPARPLVGSPAAQPLLVAIDQRATVMLAGEAVGVAERALAIATQYARVRVQFGRPIGSYQAVGHRLADSYADLEQARSLTYRAACVLADENGNADEALACAVYASTGAAIRVCEAAIQVCGGIGVTWDYPLHRWYRRALWLEAFHAARPDPLRALADLVLR